MEAAKFNLAQHSEFYPRSFFRQIYRIFDIDGTNGYITPHILKETLNILISNNPVTNEDVYLIFKRYNQQQDGMLTY